MFWMAVPTDDFYLNVFNILAFNGVTLSMSFAMDLNRGCKYVVYDSCKPLLGNHVISCRPKLS